jgi:hypothetical protein
MKFSWLGTSKGVEGTIPLIPFPQFLYVLVVMCCPMETLLNL